MTGLRFLRRFLLAVAAGFVAGVVIAILLRRRQTQLAPQPAPVFPSPPSRKEKRVDLNTASVEELATLPGIGPAIAQRIVEHRIAHGPFASAESLAKVSGIGPARVRRLAGLMAVG